MKKKIQCSYYEAFYAVRKQLPIAFIAVLPSIFYAPETLFQSIITYGFNISLTAGLFIYGILEAKNKSLTLYRVSRGRGGAERGIRLKQGVIQKKDCKISDFSVDSAVIGAGVFARIFGRVKITLTAGADKGKKGCFSFFAEKKQAKAFLRRLCRREEFDLVYKASLIKVVFWALSATNAIAGALLFIPFLNKTGELFGEYYKELLYKSIDLSPYFSGSGLPPFIGAAAGFLLAGLFASAAAIIVSFGGFRLFLSRCGDRIAIVRGYVYKTAFVTRIKRISAYELRQSVLMRVFSVWGLNFYASGQRYEHLGRKCLVPVIPKNSLFGAPSREYFNFSPRGFLAKPPRRGMRGYLYLPLVWTGAVCLIFVFGDYLPYRLEALYPIGAFALIVLIFWFFIRVFAFKRAFIYIDEKYAAVSYFRRFTYTLTFIPVSKIRCVKISRSFFQKRAALCSAAVYVYGEKKRRFVIKHLDIKNGMKFFELFT